MRAMPDPATSTQEAPDRATVPGGTPIGPVAAATTADVRMAVPATSAGRLVPVSLAVSSRRGFLRGALAVAGGAAAATLAAWTPATGSAWSYAPLRSLDVPSRPSGTTEPAHVAAEAPLTTAAGTEPLTEAARPCASRRDDKVRINVSNNLAETTGVHMHGIEFDDWTMDGIPFVTQPPIIPRGTSTYEFVATPHGSHVDHSHHDATDQVGRGLLGALIVDPADPADPAERYDTKYGITQGCIFIHDDWLGGFTSSGVRASER